MEEDVEIEYLFKANERKLLEATKQMDNITKNRELNQLGQYTSNGEIPPSFTDENHKENNSLRLVYEKQPEIDRFVDDEVNQHMLDFMATNPGKYYSSQHVDSYVAQFEDECDDDNEISSDEDWCGDDMSGEHNLKILKQSQFSGNEVILKLKAKAIPALTSLVKTGFKRDIFLEEQEYKFQHLMQLVQNRKAEIKLFLVQRGQTETSESSSEKCTFRKFGKPYFSDDVGFCPPPNKDLQQKLDYDELMIDSIPKINFWTMQQKDMLKNAIRKYLIAEKSAKLTNQIQRLTNNEMKQSNANSIVKEITELQNELRGLHKKSLKELVKGENEMKEYDWMKFSVSLFNGLHSAEECNRLWNNYLKPSINKAAWSDTEDKRLLEVATEMEFQDWEKIAKLLDTNRSGFQCFIHYVVRIEGKKDSLNGKWTEFEDKKLITLVNSSKVGDFIPWTKISSYMGNRTLNQCYTRWANSLNPELVKGRFSKEEDLLIVTAVDAFNIPIKKVASFMNNRTCSQIRERYQRHLLPKSKKIGTWSLEEDEKLLELVKNYGANNWSKIAKEIKTRSRTQVRQRYGFIKKIKEKNPEWTIYGVKNRPEKLNKKESKTTQNIENLINVVSKVENILPRSDSKKETAPVNRLAKLKTMISSGLHCKRGRKTLEFSGNSPIDCVLLDFFTNCCMELPVVDVPLQDDDSALNELLAINRLLGNELKLPNSEDKIRDNPKLSFDTKLFVNSLLNIESSNHSSTSLPKPQTSSTLKSNTKIRDSIECPYPQHDDTIIMMDWWHSPTVNIDKLNFSESLKISIFDYSNGMHKDIWESKLKRKIVNESEVKQSKPLSLQSYKLPPNKHTFLLLRSVLLSRGVLQRQKKGLCEQFPKNACKDKVSVGIDLEVVKSAYSQFLFNLHTLCFFPNVFSNTETRTTGTTLGKQICLVSRGIGSD